MRIKSIELSWFRGAADIASLNLDCKSMVIYGVNGSGKSSFVDGVEYVLNGGRIKHLAHEYSGKRQEKAIPNTHKPKGEKTALKIKFKDDSELDIQIKPDGSQTCSGAEAIAMDTWDCRRTVLRQDELATFICDTKGGKYSALLPLLGLHQIETAAENLRQLAKSIEQQPDLLEARVTLKQVEIKRKATFGTDSTDQILKKIEDLHSNYCTDKAATNDPLSRCKELEAAINSRTELFSADQQRYLILQRIAKLDLKGSICAAQTASIELADAMEPLMTERLEVLQATGVFMEKLGDEKEIKCPSCGQSIPVEAFQAHVKAEQERLKEIINTFNTRKAALGTLYDTVKSLKSSLGNVEVKSWRDEISRGPLANNFTFLDKVNADALRTSCTEDGLRTIKEELLPLIDAATLASKDAPLGVQQLSADKQINETGRIVIEANEKAATVARAETLISFINSLEQGARNEIRIRSQAVINGISADIRDMWAILHPGEPIEDVYLYLPKGVDKAIDIGLKFHGIKQDSPRLTLSEGYRNSLGLCIFLAMAKREADKDRPLFLDDVVVSLDRNHRGMIAEVLEKQFGDRQVVILTHDREWYTELRHQLDGKNWVFGALLPYETPSIGIRWSHKTTTFDDARAHLKERPDSAGNDARKIMDVELALIAERLQIRLPYLRAEKNDNRMAHDFLERLVADGEKCFQKKEGDKYVTYSEAIAMLNSVDGLLVSWANRASHTFDLTTPEATKMIDACEKALGFFQCPNCGKYVWFADAGGSEWVQCQCAEIRWRYGKG